ncbi:MAG: plasmid pRiA4b ORF-3 family protein [Janthinobacterium lividum]
MPHLLQLKVTLSYTSPPVWRRLLLPDTLTFWELHFALQIAFDWTNSHLFEFRRGRYPQEEILTMPALAGQEAADWLPEGGRDMRTATLAEMLPDVGARIEYIYDMGDNWEHQLLVEKVEPLPPGPVPPATCLTGRRNGLPEDIGGVPGYEMLLAALTKKRLPAEFHEFRGYDPATFDKEYVNEGLARLPALVREFEDFMVATGRPLAPLPA